MKRLSIAISLIIFLSACIDSDDYTVALRDIFDLEIQSTEVYADGVSVVEVRAIFDIREGKEKVKFETVDGVFLPDETKVVEHEAEFVNRNFPSEVYIQVPLRVPNIFKDSISVVASVLEEKFFQRAYIKLKRAFPEQISVSADAFVVYNSYASEITFKAKVSRGVGMVTAGAPVTFLIFDETGSDITDSDNFRETSLRTNVAGEASVIYTPGDALKPGPYYVEARTVNEAEEVVYGRLKIEVREDPE